MSLNIKFEIRFVSREKYAIDARAPRITHLQIGVEPVEKLLFSCKIQPSSIVW